MVTAEFAVVMQAVVIVMAMMMFAISVGVAHVRAQEAARVAARSAARGDDADAITAAARRNAPGADVVIERDGERVRVDVGLSVGIPGLGLHLGSISINAHSIAPQEDP